MAEKEIDQGRLWWPPGLPPQEFVNVTFNLALEDKPQRLTCEDYESKEPFEVESELDAAGLRQVGPLDGRQIASGPLRSARPAIPLARLREGVSSSSHGLRRQVA